MKVIRIGTRGSALAVWQAEWVRSQLLGLYPDHEVELVKIKTTGDKILDVPLAKVGGKGLFVKEIETALLEKRVDLAVHSMKDMPAEVPPGLCIGVIPERENPLDILISRNGETFNDLPKGARLGSSSLRRCAQVLHVRPDITVHSLRIDGRLNRDPGKDILQDLFGKGELGFVLRVCFDCFGFCMICLYYLCLFIRGCLCFHGYFNPGLFAANQPENACRARFQNVDF